MKIIRIHGTQVVLKDGQAHQHRRNLAHVKLFVQRGKTQIDTPESDYDDDVIISRHYIMPPHPHRHVQPRANHKPRYHPEDPRGRKPRQLTRKTMCQNRIKETLHLFVCRTLN